MSKFLGYWWNGRDLEIWKIGNKNVVLNGWNGKIYGACFEVDNELLNVISKEDFKIRPIYNQVFEIEDYYEII